MGHRSRIELETNLDDVTPEAWRAHCPAKLFEGGARDVLDDSVCHEKQRPGYVLHVL